MNKAQAQALVGKNLVCWTEFYGTYIGRCLEIKSEPRKPWRAVVEILAVMEYPTCGLSANSLRYLARRPFVFGEVRDFGHSSVKPYEGPIPDYGESIVTSLRKKIKLVERTIENSRLLNKPYSVELRELEILRERLRELDPEPVVNE